MATAVHCTGLLSISDSSKPALRGPRCRQSGSSRPTTGPRERFPVRARELQSDMFHIVQIIPRRFPNAKLVYLSSRTYAGYATTRLNPEPIAYESGFAAKWLIEKQLKHDSALNFDAAKGPVRSPWLSWGPYLWANGQSKRTTDGFSWERADFGGDGTHLSRAGQRKIGLLMLEFLKTDPTTRGWFNQRQADVLSRQLTMGLAKPACRPRGPHLAGPEITKLLVRSGAPARRGLRPEAVG